ncbi:hypothetical protein H5410_027823, partial [Solanum commersonii]
MNIHNKTQITYAKINCVLKDSSCDTPLLEILLLAILATCASSSSTKRTQCMFSPIGFSLVFNQLSIRFTQDQKGLSKACNGDDCK